MFGQSTDIILFVSRRLEIAHNLSIGFFSLEYAGAKKLDWFVPDPFLNDFAVVNP